MTSYEADIRKMNHKNVNNDKIDNDKIYKY